MSDYNDDGSPRPSNICVAIIDGKRIEYDMATRQRELKTRPKIYLGQGVIYSVNGARYNHGNLQYHFWRWAD